MRVHTLAMFSDCTVLQNALETLDDKTTAPLSDLNVLKHIRAHEIETHILSPFIKAGNSDI